MRFALKKSVEKIQRTALKILDAALRIGTSAKRGGVWATKAAAIGAGQARRCKETQREGKARRRLEADFSVGCAGYGSAG
jgi:hypothetical protein